jgi:16S rRNA (adenine1518-N6/adenine1519-N6)-dimethyltransferase
MFTEEQIIAAGVTPTDRPEAVPLEGYVALANLLKQPV